MTSGFQVTCANKNQNGTIVRIGGPDWNLSLQEAVHKINSKQLRLHIFIGDQYFDIGVRRTEDDAFLVLEPDGKPLAQVGGLGSC